MLIRVLYYNMSMPLTVGILSVYDITSWRAFCV
uniref:Uncharacterized protein n=1 Tax=Anguilla anguilla TaxID=7936 RepID=A0A0E9SGP0_ANGAN